MEVHTFVSWPHHLFKGIATELQVARFAVTSLAKINMAWLTASIEIHLLYSFLGQE